MRARRTSPRLGRSSAAALLALAIALVAWLAPGVARAWVELHVARDDVRVALEQGGTATVEHRIVLLVSGGPLERLSVRGVDDDAEIDPTGYVVLKKDADKGALEGARPIRVERKSTALGESTRTDLEIEIDGGQGIGRGTYLLFVRYRTDLLARGLLVPDGSAATLAWRGPSWDDGLETTRALFEVPQSANVPRVVELGEDDEPELETSLSSLTRRPGVDALEIVRPYAPRGERVEWRVRVDRRALGLAEERSATPSALAARGDADAPALALALPALGDLRSSAALALAITAFLALALLVVGRELELARRAEERALVLRALVPMPIWLRAPGVAFAMLAGIALHLELASSLPGALAVAVGTALAWRLPAVPRTQLRGPGTWLAVHAREVFDPAPVRERSYFDPSTRAGRLGLAALVLLVAAGSGAIARSSSYHAVLFALDALPLFALWLTGQGRALAPDLAASPIAFFASVQRALRPKSGEGLRVIPRLRLPRGSADADELRLTVLPKRALPGLSSFEIAVAPELGPGGWILLPELLVRVRTGSPSHEAAMRLAPHGLARPGRKPDELVLAFAPKLPTAKLTAELCHALLRSFSAAEADAATSNGETAATKSGAAESKRKAPVRTASAPRTSAKPQRERSSASAARVG